MHYTTEDLDLIKKQPELVEDLYIDNVYDFFPKLVNLKKLSIDDHLNLRLAHEDFEGIPTDKLTHFKVSAQLTEFPPKIREMKQLECLELGNYWEASSSNFIFMIPEWIVELENLEKLYIQGNDLRHIEDFPESLNQCKKLKSISLSSDNGDDFRYNPICKDYEAMQALRAKFPNIEFIEEVRFG